MKKGSLLDKVLTWGIRISPLVVINQAVYPEVLNNWAQSWETNGISKINTNNVEIPDLSNLTYDARALLDLANFLVHQNEAEGAVCRDYVKSTLEVYRKLVEKTGKPNLAYCVRSAYDTNPKGGHNFIEILEGRDQWVKYESMHKTPILTPDNVKDYSDLTQDQRTLLNGDPNRTAHVVCQSGSNCHPTLDAYLSPGGNLALLAKAFFK